MAITRQILLKIKEEIINDPENIGYVGKTDDEIVALLNSPVIKQSVSEEIYAPPINRILSGIADSANFITKQELAQAKAVI